MKAQPSATWTCWVHAADCSPSPQQRQHNLEQLPRSEDDKDDNEQKEQPNHPFCNAGGHRTESIHTHHLEAYQYRTDTMQTTAFMTAFEAGRDQPAETSSVLVGRFIPASVLEYRRRLPHTDA